MLAARRPRVRRSLVRPCVPLGLRSAMVRKCLFHHRSPTLPRACAHPLTSPLACSPVALVSLRAQLNTFYLMWAAALVFLMQAGFAMLSAGSIRAKNVKNILLKSLLDACLGGIIWYLIGYGIACTHRPRPRPARLAAPRSQALRAALAPRPSERRLPAPRAKRRE